MTFILNYVSLFHENNDDMSVTHTSLVACLRFSALDGCLYTTLSFITVHRFSMGCSRLIPAQRSYFSSGTLVTGAASCMDVYVQFQLLFEQFHVLGSIHGGVRRSEIQTSRATARHGSARVSLWLQHISCQNAYPTAA